MGRGTLKIAELTQLAGLVPPEFEATPHDVLVRFRPSGYVAPLRISHNLSALQRELLQVLADKGAIPLRQILTELSIAKRTLQDNLQTLRNMGLVELKGSGWSAKWQLKGTE